MITRSKIEIYERFDGDSDGFARGGSVKEKSIVTGVEFELIAGLMEDLQSINKGLCSNEFTNNVLKKMEEQCDNDETRNMLRGMALK